MLTGIRGVVERSHEGQKGAAKRRSGAHDRPEATAIEIGREIPVFRHCCPADARADFGDISLNRIPYRELSRKSPTAEKRPDRRRRPGAGSFSLLDRGEGLS